MNGAATLLLKKIVPSALIVLMGSWTNRDISAQDLLLPQTVSRLSPRTYQEIVSLDYISIDDGLPTSYVKAVTSDKRGFIWIGTENGLCRFDGYTCVVYRHEETESTSISGNIILTLFVDREGSLWVGTTEGLNKNEAGSPRFVRYRYDRANASSLSHNDVLSICEDQSGMLWVGTRGGGLNRLDKTTGLFTIYRHSENPVTISSDYVYSIFEDSHGTLWVGTLAGLDSVDKARGTFTRLGSDRRRGEDLGQEGVFSISEDSYDNLWLGVRGGMVRLNRERTGFARFQYTPSYADISGHKRKMVEDPTLLPPGQVQQSVDEDARANLWIGAGVNGLLGFNPMSGEFSRPVDGFDSITATCIYVDERVAKPPSSRILWVGTYGHGLIKVKNTKSPFWNYRCGSARSLFAGSSDFVWVGTEFEGMVAVNTRTGQSIRYKHDPTNPRSLPSNQVQDIEEDGDGSIWVLTWEGGLSRLDRESNKFFHYFPNPSDSNSLFSNFTSHLVVDRSGILWVGTQEGVLHRFDPDSGKFLRIHLSPPGWTGSCYIHDVLESRTGILWVGMEGGGLVQYDGVSATTVRYMNEPGNTVSLSDDVVLSLYEDSSGVLWVGTTNGLNELRPGAGGFVRHSFPNDPSLNLVLAVIGDSGGDLWLTTSKGLVHYDPSERVYSIFGRTEGLMINDPSSGAIVRTHGGEIYVGGSSGLAGFHPDSIRENTVVPPIVITSMNVMGISLWPLPEFRLPYDQNSLSFEFALLDFTAPERNGYAYMLEGFDADWTRSGTRRYANYTNLDAGEYIFRVKGSNSDGVWGEKTASVAIVITPPFWDRWWFRGGLIILIAGVLTIGHRYRMAQLLRVERLRLRIASDLHDDIGSRLSSIALMGDVARKRASKPSDYQTEVLTISRFARQMVSELKDIVWVIDPENDSMEDFLQRMKDATAELLSGVEYSLNLDHPNTGIVLEMETRRNLLLIYKEVLHNIVQHAWATHVDITLKSQENGISLLVADNGRGFAPETAHHGNGTKTIHRRVEQLNGTVEVTSSPGTGTMVLVHIPRSGYGQRPRPFLRLYRKPPKP